MTNYSIAKQFDIWAKKQPETAAIIEDSSSVSYRELENKAASLTQKMIDLGTVKGDRVPIITKGGSDMVAGMLACLRLAAIFVPIDVGGPKSRTRRMLRDLSPHNAIVDPGLDASHLLDESVSVISGYSGDKSPVIADLEDSTVIYGFFTSGSTGTPKCCLNTHLGLSNRFEFNSTVRPLQPGDAILQNSKHTFDPVLWQTLWPLTQGATVVIPNRTNLLDIQRTVETIQRRNVVMTDIVPSVLSVLLDYLELFPNEVPKMASLEELFVGGEEISSRLVRRSLDLLPNIRLTNTYGPTEAAIGMVYHHFDGTEETDIPLGKPIPGTCFAIVDEDLAPVDNGVTGQLAISGNCLGVGYFNDDAKTAASFKNIEIGTEHVRHFLTGDRVVMKDGLIFFRGRTDKQLKVRGVRVELKEIEECYERYPDIVQFRVVPDNACKDELRLHAFYTARKKLTEAELRSIARESLPPEFSPATFTQLIEFETTSSGKIDRSVLKKMTDNVDPVNSIKTKELVAEIVKTQLGREVLPNENLFEAGLDSLSAMRMVLTIEEQFKKSISSSELYANPSIAGINSVLFDNPNTQELFGTDLKAITRWSEVSTAKYRTKSAVLLTGATGYLGTNLLADLTQQNSKVVCLVRANSVTNALHRLHMQSLKFGAHSDVIWENVDVVLGDLSKDELGLDQTTIDQLVGSITAIYNAGADVSFVKPFSQLENCNVRAVTVLARMAMTASDCHFHHISSTAALSDASMPLNQLPEVPKEPPPGGYGQSKLAAELAINSLMSEGLKASIYRLGEVMPSRSNIKTNPKSSVVCFLRTLVYLGAAPDCDDTLDYCPIDVVTRTIAEPGCRVSGFVGLANQERVQLRSMVEGMNLAGANIKNQSRSTVYEAIKHANRHPFAPDYVSIVWNTIKSYGPTQHWPIMSGSKRPKFRAGDIVSWPHIDTHYLTSALSDIASTSRDQVVSEQSTA